MGTKTNTVTTLCMKPFSFLLQKQNKREKASHLNTVGKISSDKDILVRDFSVSPSFILVLMPLRAAAAAVAAAVVVVVVVVVVGGRGVHIHNCLLAG
eukprot:gnl/Hemi2/1738_TR617_c0_g1_i1.p2 gnl/Hemi2/1738_TR617_c0_g1~~gnl/Hemi2/1738_TR617_c0_g1_i1.p2  ORF type:complete len:108 (+),score=30.66 gnl/Hemi2/1738_TR617_c0_g1_i1:36-326(+)